MRQVIKIAIAAATAATLTLAGCAPAPAPAPEPTNTGAAPTSPSPEPAEKIMVGLAFDVGGRGDQSFNDAAALGLDTAAAEFKGIETKDATASADESEAVREERLQQLIEAGFNNIVAVGFAYANAVGKVAAANPDVKFAIVDDASEASQGPNVMNLTFAANEGSFLVGAAAALKSETGHIGFVGGVQVGLIQNFQAGFEAGAKAVKPDIKIDVNYLTQPPDFSGFGDPAKGEVAAKAMFDSGADIVYHAAGGSGGGVFNAAKAAGKWAIGVDADQALTASPEVQDIIMTSMIKRVDVGVYNFVKSIHDGTFTAGEHVFDLAADGVGYSTTGGHIDDIAPQLEEFKAQIIAGSITVPTEVS